MSILAGLGALINPASTIATTLLGELFGKKEEEKEAAPVVAAPAPPVFQAPPVETGPSAFESSKAAYFGSGSYPLYADGGLVRGPRMTIPEYIMSGGQTNPADQSMVWGPGGAMPSIKPVGGNPAWQPLASGLNSYLNMAHGDMSFLEQAPGYNQGGLIDYSNGGYADGGPISPEVQGIIDNSREGFATTHTQDFMGGPPSTTIVNQRSDTQGMAGRHFNQDVRAGWDVDVAGQQAGVQAEWNALNSLTDEDVIEKVMEALSTGEDPGMLMDVFVERFGEQALADVQSKVQAMAVESDGLSDSVPAVVDGSQPAALSEGEFVMPADVVSGLGNGSTDAGSKRLMQMIDNVRKARMGTPEKPSEVNPSEVLR